MNVLKTAIIGIAIAGAGYFIYTLLANSGKPGMKEAVFDKNDMQQVMARTNTTAIRFYAARKFKTDLDGTAIVIGTEAGGKDLYVKNTSPYVISMGVVGGGTDTRNLDEAQALQDLSWIKQVGDLMFATNFSLVDLNKLLNHTGSNGIKLVTEGPNTNGDYTMTAYAVKIEGGNANVIVGSPMFTCPQPCPVVCGTHQEYYLNKRL